MRATLKTLISGQGPALLVKDVGVRQITKAATSLEKAKAELDVLISPATIERAVESQGRQGAAMNREVAGKQTVIRSRMGIEK